MFKKTFKSTLYVVPITIGLILVATHIWNADYLIAPPPYSGFVLYLEYSLAVLLIAFFSFILPNKYEIELGLVNGYRTVKLALTKAFPIYIYTLIISILAVIFYQYKPFDIESGFSTAIPVYVPNNYKLFMCISVFVTISFFSSLFFVIRLLVKNCFFPVFIDIGILIALFNFNDELRRGLTDIRMCFFDPFITVYFVGNTVPNSLSDNYSNLNILKNAWLYNRIFFLILTFALIVISIIILRRDNLHKIIGE
ncbi:MAG: hypothetical protein IKI03_09030 [Clostridia bacterium]|nr:hypothetical protein [Clostridia bacterium]